MVTRKIPRDAVVEGSMPDEDDPVVDESLQRILRRPDGYYWLAPDGKQEFGPFDNLEFAQADMASGDDEMQPHVGETLQEAENEIGIADWIDPETGQPAEGQSPPHLEEE